MQHRSQNLYEKMKLHTVQPSPPQLAGYAPSIVVGEKYVLWRSKHSLKAARKNKDLQKTISSYLALVVDEYTWDRLVYIGGNCKTLFL